MVLTHRLLQLRNMKYWVNSRMSRQIQSISNRANPCSDVEGTEETKGKLLVGARGKQSLNIRLQLQVDLIPNLKASF